MIVRIPAVQEEAPAAKVQAGVPYTGCPKEQRDSSGVYCCCTTLE